MRAQHFDRLARETRAHAATGGVGAARADVIVSTFGGHGHWAGQFYGAHNIAVNSKGDLFVTETYEGKRVQKFTYTGLGAPSVAP